MKIIYAGTPEFAVEPLLRLHDAGYEITVLTQPDKPQGRKRVLTPPPVKKAALELGLPVIQPESLKKDLSALKAVGADLMITCAYGQILTQEALDLFPKGVWNIHASLLPAYRGAAPVPSVILNGESVTGVTIMKTDVGLDTGDILCQEQISIDEADTSDSLFTKLSSLGAQMIKKALPNIISGDYKLTPQGEGFVCKKVQRTQIDFSLSASQVSRTVRALSSSPLSFGVVDGLILNFYMAEEVEWQGDEPFGAVLSDSPKQGFLVKCGENAVNITILQPSGGKPMSAKDFLNGRKVAKGDRFDQPVL